MIGSYGNKPSPTPFLDGIFEQGYSLTSCYSTGYPTQFALPGLLTSTLPLDHGGYQYGIRDRPIVLSELFANKGYNTGAFLNGFWNDRLFSYDRGIATFCPLYDLGYWVRNLPSVYLSYGQKQLEDPQVPEEHIIEILVPFIGKFLEGVICYCLERRAEKDGEREHPRHESPSLHGWDFSKAIEIAKDARQSYENAPEKFTRSLLDSSTDSFLGQLDNTRDTPNQGLMIDRKLRVVSLLASYLIPWPIPRFPMGAWGFARMAKRWLDNSRKSSSGGYTLENLESWINEQNDSYWVWGHIFDVHNKNMFSWELDDNRFGTEIEELRSYLSGHKNGWSETNRSLSQALSLRYVDATLERFFESVYEDREEPPLVVLTSDHGTLFPYRDGDHVNLFYDELLHIPVVFVHPNIESGSYDGLCSAIDIGPTVLDLLGMESPDGFKGESIQNLPEGGREYVVAEDMGRGPVDPMKPAKITVRSANKKVVCSAPILDNETRLEIIAAYNLHTDPGERNPIVESELPPSFSTIVSCCHQRTDQIRRSLL
jgi:hypothetical protein